MKKILFFIFISLLLHLNSYFGLYYATNHWLKTNTASVLTQIDIVERDKPQKSQREKTIVKQLDVEKDNLLDSDIPARFESAIRQRVIKETQASQLGVASNNTSSNNTENQKAQEIKREFEDFVIKKQNPFSTNSSTLSNISAFNQNLPNDIDFADVTNLNTDANIYYSFYNRIQELFYIRWIENLNSVWNRIPEEIKIKELANRQWSTILEIWLNSSGEYHSSYIYKSSGYEPFDGSIVKAFKDARFFPNPPQAKVEPDGYIRLRYRFIVHVGPYR